MARRGVKLVALIVTGLLAMSPAIGRAGGVTFADGAHVLSASDQQSIQSAAQPLSFSVAVITVTGGFANNKTGFVNEMNTYVNSQTLVIAVDTSDRFSHVAAGTATGLSSAQLLSAKDAASADFGAGKWGAGILTALQSVAAVAPKSSAGTNAAVVVAFVLGAVVIFGGLGWLIVRAARRQAASGGPSFGAPGYGTGYGYGYGDSSAAYQQGRWDGERDADRWNRDSGGGGGIVQSDSGGGGSDFGSSSSSSDSGSGSSGSSDF